jgi:hypothetical protein
MSETLILDPSEETDGRTELNINSGAITVAAEGIDWGTAELEVYAAKQERGSSPVDFRYPNRAVNIPLVLKTAGTADYETARRQLHMKVARIQREGGVLKRGLSSGGTLYIDVVDAKLTQGDQWLSDHRDAEPGVVLTLDCIPDFYGAETTLSDHSETTAAELIFTETSIDGDYPGRVRIVVDEDDADAQRGLIWGVRSRNYSSASTAALEYEAEELEALGGATKPAVAGASGGTVVYQAALSPDWTPVVGGRIAGATYPTHTGNYRVFARITSTDDDDIQGRLTWSLADMVNPVVNDVVTPQPFAGDFQICDFGSVHIVPSPVGTHRWNWQLEFKGDVGGEDINVDKVWLVPTDEGMGVLSAPIAHRTFTSYVSDGFNQSAGALTGKTADSGQTWGGAGDADDFSLDTTNDTITRAAVSDTAPGRVITLSAPTTATGVTVSVDVKWTDPSFGPSWGVLARYVDASNFLGCRINPSTFAGSGKFSVIKHVAGVFTDIAEITPGTALPAIHRQSDVWHTVTLTVDVDGSFIGSITTAGSTLTLTGQDDVLKTSGTLDDGKVGIWDYTPFSNAATRTYDNFSATYHTGSTSQTEAVMYPSQSVQLTTEGMFREDSGGVAYGNVAKVIGDLPRIPPAGLEGSTVQFFIKGSRGDIYTLPDSGIDNISARVSYRPSFIFVPEA